MLTKTTNNPIPVQCTIALLSRSVHSLAMHCTTAVWKTIRCTHCCKLYLDTADLVVDLEPGGRGADGQSFDPSEEALPCALENRRCAVCPASGL